MGLFRWLQRAKGLKHRKAWYITGLIALIYWVWASRNGVIWQDDRMEIDEVVRRVKKGVIERVLVLGVKTGTAYCGVYLYIDSV